MLTGFLDVLDFEKRSGIAPVVQDVHDDLLVGLREIVDAEPDCPDIAGSCRFGNRRIGIGDPVKSPSVLL